MLVRVAEPAELPAVYALREEVFVREQGVPEELERDELDEVAVHAVASADGEVVGTGRLVPPGRVGPAAAIGRLAVRADVRGTGAGAALLAVLEACARERGWTELELHAQAPVVGFYERYGWQPFGERYLEAGIEHVSMRKQLAAPARRGAASA